MASNNAKTDKTANAVVETKTDKTAETTSEVKKVKITLPVLRGEKDQRVFVGVNDETFMITRGKEVEVPDYVAEVLRNSDNALNEADAYSASVSTD